MKQTIGKSWVISVLCLPFRTLFFFKTCIYTE